MVSAVPSIPFRRAGALVSACSDTLATCPRRVTLMQSPSSSMERADLPNGSIKKPSKGCCCSRINELGLVVAFQLALLPGWSATVNGLYAPTDSGPCGE